MGNRKVELFEKRRIVRVFAVLLLVAGFGAAAGIGTRAGAAPCADIDVVVARGTQEPGFLGAVIGDPLYWHLRQTLPGSVTAYPVHYPANLLDPDSLSAGTRDMTDHLVHQSAICPDQRFILVGYSQGAAVTQGVLGTGIVATLAGVSVAPPEVAWRISAVLLFGDPVLPLGWQVPAAYLGRTANYCAGGDPVCGGGMDPATHARYGDFMWAAANFAAGRI